MKFVNIKFLYYYLGISLMVVYKSLCLLHRLLDSSYHPH